MQPILPRRTLLIIHKSFIKTHLGYGDVIYDQLSTVPFSNQTESVQYNASLLIKGAIKGFSCVKLYQEFGFEYLKQRRWMRRLCLLYKFLSTEQPSHIHDLLPQMRNSHRRPNTCHVFPCRTEYFKNSFFLHVIINECNKLDPNISSSSNYDIFCNALLKFIRPVERKVFNINVPYGIKIIARLRLGFSHLYEHKFRHGFKDTLNPLWSCSTEAETTKDYFLFCHFNNPNQVTLINVLE